MSKATGESKLQPYVDMLWAAWQMLRFEAGKAHAWLPLRQGREEAACTLAVFLLMLRSDVGFSELIFVLAVNVFMVFLFLSFGAIGRRFLLSFMGASIGMDAVMILVNLTVPKEMVTSSVVMVSNVIETLVFITAGFAGHRQIQLDEKRLKEQGR